MGYGVRVQGRLLLPAERADEAFTTLRDAFWRGEPFDGPAPDFNALAALFCVATDRAGDWIILTPTVDDPKWTDRTTAFYGALRTWVDEGDVVTTGEDGAEWRYKYRNGTVTQSGVNGYDGTESVTSAIAVPPGESDAPSSDPGRPPRLKRNSANLICTSTDVSSIGHPAPWTADLAAADIRSGVPDGLEADDAGLSYLLSLLEDDDRSAREHAQFVSLVERHASGSGELAEVTRLAASARMVIIAWTRAPAFDEAQLARIADLQERLDAVVVYEDQLIIRGADGAIVTIPMPTDGSIPGSDPGTDRVSNATELILDVHRDAIQRLGD